MSSEINYSVPLREGIRSNPVARRLVTTLRDMFHSDAADNDETVGKYFNSLYVTKVPFGMFFSDMKPDMYRNYFSLFGDILHYNPIALQDVYSFLVEKDIIKLNFGNSKDQVAEENVYNKMWEDIRELRSLFRETISRTVFDGWEDRVRFWADEEMTDAKRQELAESWFDGDITDLPRSGWRERRDWLYKKFHEEYIAGRLEGELSGGIGAEKTLKEELEPDSFRELLICVKVDRLAVEALTEGRLWLNQLQTSYEGNVENIAAFLEKQFDLSTILPEAEERVIFIREFIERSLERLWQIKPFLKEDQPRYNPGLILGNRLVLTEFNQIRLAGDGAIRTWYRDQIRSAHTDKGGSGRAARIVNFVNEVLAGTGRKSRFIEWKTGKLKHPFYQEAESRNNQ